MLDILISERIRGAAAGALSSRFDVAILPELWRTPGELSKRVSDFRALMVRNQTQVTASLSARGDEARRCRAGRGRLG